MTLYDQLNLTLELLHTDGYTYLDEKLPSRGRPTSSAFERGGLASSDWGSPAAFV